MHKNNWKIFVLLLAGIATVPFLAYAASSTNYGTTQESGGPVDGAAASANYKFNAEIGHPGVGISTSTNYTYWHGVFWEEPSTTEVTIQWAIPEMRVNATTTNEDALFYLVVKNPVTHAVVYTMPYLATTTLQGTYASSLNMGVADGTYDIGIKTHQHLTKILRNVNLIAGGTSLNFTQASNTVPFGPITLLAGDVSGSTSTPALMGDDVVNSVDLSIMINVLDRDDVTTRGIRANLNQDPVINSVDMSLMIKNLDVTGDL